MKTKIETSNLLTIATALTFLVASCGKDDIQPQVIETPNINVANLEMQLNNLPKEALNADEQSSLLFMREEEKLAKDVYITMYNVWGAKIFSNISKSEQTHMDAVLLLLTKYSLIDPVGANAVGVFHNGVLQDLYDQLVTQGNISLANAYQVGATIEDLDIFDLTNALTKNDNQDIKLVYDMLSKGSRNHLRSFYGNILNIGSSYTPQYITREEFDAIINSPMERGF